MANTVPATALVLHGARDLRLETKNIPPPTGTQVQIAIRATGICGSDLHYYKHGANGHFVLREPTCMGHESSGIITAIGPDVPNNNNNNISANHHLRVGDRVALEVGIPCRQCSLCKTGRYNICPEMRFRSSCKTFPHLDGTLMELTNHPAELCHRLPDNVSFVGGALAEPLAVCLHAIRRSRPPSRDEVEITKACAAAAAAAAGGNVKGYGGETAALVFGAGAIGLLLASALATSENFTKIVVADIDVSRLKIAESLGLGLETTLIPTATNDSSDQDHHHPPSTASHEDRTAHALQTAQNLADTLRDTHSLPHGFSRVYDCTGVPACVQAGIYAAVAGGVLVQIGMGHPVQTLPVGAAALREVDIIGVFRYDGYAYPAAIALLASGKLAAVEEKVVTHRLKLKEGERAFELAGKGVDEDGRPVVKVIIES